MQNKIKKIKAQRRPVQIVLALFLSIITLSSALANTLHTANAEVLVSQSVQVTQNTQDNLDYEDNCSFIEDENAKYDIDLITIRKKLRVEPGEVFTVKVFLRNNSSVPLFSKSSSCEGDKLSIGLDSPRDRISDLRPFKTSQESNWKEVSRIYMDQERVNPGEIASFTFEMKAIDTKDIYKEFFTPVIEGKKWLDDDKFIMDVLIGKNADTPAELRQKLLYTHTSGSVSDLDLNAEKKIVVDVSEQMLYAYLGEHVVRKFRISSGKSSTPTPYGETQITLKQELRIGHAAPHYRMPYFMMFRAGGYGFHALPYLANDGGTFWSEALDHIGTPVSHGCVRLLPEDAEFLYNFTPISTKVIIQP